jgi:hypothetical protein
MKAMKVIQGRERGIVLVTTLMLMMLMSALLAGFSLAVVSDQQFRGVDRERATAFYAAHAGLEKLTADLGGLFAGNFAPNGAQVNALEGSVPTLDGLQFLAADGGAGYTISFDDTNADGNPDSAVRQIQDGPFEGLMGQVTPYTVDVTARTEKGADVHLQREMQTVTIPISACSRRWSWGSTPPPCSTSAAASMPTAICSSRPTARCGSGAKSRARPRSSVPSS